MENIRKFTAVAQIKWLCISKNNTLMSGIAITILMVLGYKFLYGLNSGGHLSPVLLSLLLNLGISMNICMDGFLMVGTEVAEEKEKHTLRVLMTSSVTGIQYFLGSIIYPFIITIVLNFAILFISGIPMEQVSLPLFLVVNIIASLTSCIIGMIVGICAKNQMNANLISYPFIMLFMMLPLLGGISEFLHKLSGFVFTGVITEMTECFANGEKYVLKPLAVVVLASELVISLLVFLLLYRRNGYEKD